MGADASRLQTDIEGYNRNFSEEHKISAWVGMPPKNADYYNGDRFFVVDKDKYRCYEKGWVYGHSYLENNEPDIKENKQEEDRIKLQKEITEIKRRVAELTDHELAL